MIRELRVVSPRYFPLDIRGLVLERVRIRCSVVGRPPSLLPTRRLLATAASACMHDEFFLADRSSQKFAGRCSSKGLSR